jgi:hypothetical protein
VCIVASCFWNLDYSSGKGLLAPPDTFKPRYLISENNNAIKDISVLEEEIEEKDQAEKHDDSKTEDPFDNNKSEEIESKNQENNNKNALMTREEMLKKDFIDISVFANKKFQVGDINLSKYLKYINL